MARPNNLCPTRAKCFNEPTVQKHFRELRKIKERYNIRPENTYNIDEKGIQTGGGHTKSNKKFFFAANNNARYRLRSADLELVTVLETVSSTGKSLTPRFVFQKGDWAEESFDVPGTQYIR